MRLTPSKSIPTNSTLSQTQGILRSARDHATPNAKTKTGATWVLDRKLNSPTKLAVIACVGLRAQAGNLDWAKQ